MLCFLRRFFLFLTFLEDCIPWTINDEQGQGPDGSQDRKRGWECVLTLTAIRFVFGRLERDYAYWKDPVAMFTYIYMPKRWHINFIMLFRVSVVSCCIPDRVKLLAWMYWSVCVCVRVCVCVSE